MILRSKEIRSWVRTRVHSQITTAKLELCHRPNGLALVRQDRDGIMLGQVLAKDSCFGLFLTQGLVIWIRLS